VALDDVVRQTAGGRAFLGFDDLGVCLIENIDPKRMEYVLGRLEGDGLIEQFADQSEPGNRPIKATSAGLRAADGLRGISEGPALLMEEAIALVERVVDRHAPQVTQRLREIAKRIYESRELNHADVGEIAQALDLSIQDFLDIDAFWDAIDEERPRRDRTKDRISALLKSKVDSETEQELMPALGNYLFGWFGPLDAFVNKHRHPLIPELSSRFDAKRLLLYTYMLMADLIEVLRLS
jgi:hypothetical protein